MVDVGCGRSLGSELGDDVIDGDKVELTFYFNSRTVVVRLTKNSKTARVKVYVLALLLASLFRVA